MGTPMKKADLELFLKQYNMWYRGMTMHEMRECRQALENSLCDSSGSDKSTLNSSNDSAEHLSTSTSSVDGLRNTCDINYNNFSSFRYSRERISTTAVAPESSPPSSPEVGHRFVVRADVHHEMNWSPKRYTKGTFRKKL